MNSSKQNGIIWIVATVLLATVAAFGIGRLAKKIPWSVEKKIASILPGLEQQTCSGKVSRAAPRASGDHAGNLSGNSSGKFSGKPKEASAAQRPAISSHLSPAAALKKLEVRLFPIFDFDAGVPIDIQIADNPEVNAFATLGGQIYIFDGLLKEAESAEEVAGVLAHEIEHVRLRHIMESSFSKILIGSVTWMIDSSGGLSITQSLLNLKFGRDQERAADRAGLERLAKAGIDPKGYLSFFERQKNKATVPEIISDHPSDDSRIEQAAKFNVEKPVPIFSNQEDWLSLKAACENSGK
jgi:hypothetical protein